MEKYLRKCLESLIVPNENMELLEVMIINDGSKDSSSLIAHEYEMKYPQTFRVIDKENGNYGSCINRGIKEAAGKYVKILDADDSFDTPSFSLFLNFLTTRDEDIIISDVDSVDTNGVILKKARFKMHPIQTLTIDQMPMEIIEMHALTYKLSILKGIFYKQTEGISYTDNEWSTIPFVYMKTIIYFPKPVYKYLMGRYGQTIGVLVKNSDQFKTVLYNIFKQFEGNDTLGQAKSYINFRIQHILMCLYKEFLITDQCRNLKKIICFDKQLKKDYPQYYILADNIVLNEYVPYHYIRHWRMNYSSHIPLAWLHRLIAYWGSKIRILIYN